MLGDTGEARRREAIRAEIRQFCPSRYRLPLAPLAGALLALLDALAVVASLWNE